jgi:DNA repair protein RecN (Recombination protein N)
MLQELRIRNFAIIEDLSLDFRKGLSIFTGETGAGKSILVDAVELIVGGRAASDLIRTGCDEAVLEAVFTALPPGPAADRLKEMSLVERPEDEVVVRRIIPRSGKGRIYLNGGLIPLGLLQQVGEKLVDIHGQHEHQSLLKSDEQLDLLDAYGNLFPLREAYGRAYAEWRSTARQLEALRASEQDRERQEDLLRFQREEIASAQLRPGEEEALQSARNRLAHSDRLIRLSAEAYECLYGADGAVQSLAARVRKLMEELSAIDPGLEPSLRSVEAIEANVQELTDRIRGYRDRIEHEPGRLEEIEDRLHLIGRLKKKYGPALEDVIESLKKVEAELDGLVHRDERIERLDGEIREKEKGARELAARLTRDRKKVSARLKEGVEKELKPLGMERAGFEVRFSPVSADGNPGAAGAERPDFFIAPNPGEEARLLSRSASGGELSRIMLALKVILCDVDPVPTLVFDEVDAGIGGTVAAAVGERLRRLARHRQVFCITHLPQIAAMGATHFSVEKRTGNGRTVARAAALEGKDRVDEIARMLGGRKITPAALKHAKEMLAQ